ncbi:MAG: pseudouridine-5'-phosphate glycosidase [Candidatus Eisenbacteria bacterium]|uniref:Pseudouridine-5'-phosphate glycosidase n=1 Tax=Eiseniibacteriota bacterium TaxID=2212470 RepID=A0A849SNJ9_UNCEI|nr:pseudouridine-5'-phosphate glycosidase [Candidatus Eisenbacteria bacterium]
MTRLIRIAPFVEAALRDHRPVVALETTVVTHGLPEPQGFELAGALEAEIIRHGAVPATIGVLKGCVRVGLSRDELSELAHAPEVAKLNLSNLGAQLAEGGPGSTTVAATMFIAARCGIQVFATGGIGGVHRGESETGDVSADLTALAHHPVAVVCAGAKAVLDLPRTVEALETLGVPILGFGTAEFPAFWRRSSGLPVDRRYDELAPLARAIRAHWELGATSGVVVANPIPEADEMDAALYETALNQALSDARQRQSSGRDVTPFLLDRMRELTGGASVQSNLALLVNNARVAAELAAAIEAVR